MCWWMESCVKVLPSMHPCNWYTGGLYALWCHWFVNCCFSDARVFVFSTLGSGMAFVYVGCCSVLFGGLVVESNWTCLFLMAGFAGCCCSNCFSSVTWLVSNSSSCFNISNSSSPSRFDFLLMLLPGHSSL